MVVLFPGKKNWPKNITELDLNVQECWMIKDSGVVMI